MKKNIANAKTSFLPQEHTVDMHEETMEWLSELEFCKIEFEFLGKLMDKAFLKATRKDTVDKLNLLDRKVKLFHEKTLKELHDSIIRHESHLAALDENAFAYDAHAIRTEHKRKKLSVQAFMGALKKIKKEVYRFVELQVKQAKDVSLDFQEGRITL